MSCIVITEKNLSALLEEQRTELSGYEFKEINLTNVNLKSAIFLDCKFTQSRLNK